VLGASAAKSAASGLSRGGGWLASTGAQILMALSAIAATTIGVGRLLARRGRGTTLGRPSFD
jgi:hypothetical protein